MPQIDKSNALYYPINIHYTVILKRYLHSIYNDLCYHSLSLSLR